MGLGRASIARESSPEMHKAALRIAEPQDDLAKQSVCLCESEVDRHRSLQVSLRLLEPPHVLQLPRNLVVTVGQLWELGECRLCFRQSPLKVMFLVVRVDKQES